MGQEQELADLLRPARRVLVFTGAGVSTPSGIPDFRGPQGIWKRRQPVYYQDFMTSEEARVVYWEGKLEGWESYRTASPNPVHESIVRLAQAGKLEMLVTQNVDGLHRKAGTSAERLVEIHGTFWIESNVEIEARIARRKVQVPTRSSNSSVEK